MSGCSSWRRPAAKTLRSFGAAGARCTRQVPRLARGVALEVAPASICVLRGHRAKKRDLPADGYSVSVEKSDRPRWRMNVRDVQGTDTVTVRDFIFQLGPEARSLPIGSR